MRRRLMCVVLFAGLGFAVQGTITAFADLSVTTRANWRLLNVPLFHQIHGLDCEAAALQMALASEGHSVSQDSILGVMGIDSRAPFWDIAGNFHWGDPYTNFVGNPDGAERLLTGYGTYFPTVVRAAQQFGGSVVQAGEGIAPSTIYQALLNGNPVVVWVSFDWRFHQVTHYVAFDGRAVQFGSPYEHSVTLIGVTTDFVLVNNPWFGQQWISKPTFESAYATFNNMAVIMGGPGGSPSTATAGVTAPPPTSTDTYHPLSPARILDTRNGTGAPVKPLGPGATLDVAVAGQGGVPPSGASAAVLNVTVTDTTGASYLTVFPSGGARFGTSNLNWRAGQVVANLVQVGVGANGNVSVFNAGGSADVVIDVEGWFGPASTPSGTDGLFNSLAPSRLLDTRGGTGGTRGGLNGGQTLSFQVSGRGGVPQAGAAAVVLNVTVTNPTAAGFVTAFPAGVAMPVASNLNFLAGQTLPNRVIVPLGAGGQVSLYNSAGTADLVADVGGWFTDASGAGHGSHFISVAPQRVLDTRAGFGGIPPGGTGVTQVAELSQANASAVVMNATVTNANAPSYLVLWPDGNGRPLASDLNYVAGQTVPNLAIVRLGAGGGFDFYNAAGSTDLVLDVVGYYGPVT